MNTILVADDDALFRAIMKRHLTQMGLAVVEASSGKNVLELIRQHQPVACLIDLIMDEQEGLETITEIADLTPRPRVIAVSSNGAYLPWAEDLGADAILHKPIAPDTLKATLAHLGIGTA